MEPIKRQTPLRGELVWEVDYGMIHGVRKRVTCEDENGADRRLEEYKRNVERAG